MWLILQHRTADDYVVATGETHSVREFVEAAFAVVDLPWEKYVKHDESFDRPTEPARLVGCAGKNSQDTGLEADWNLSAVGGRDGGGGARGDRFRGNRFDVSCRGRRPNPR